MDNSSLIYSVNIPSITLHDALLHTMNDWFDAVVAESRIKDYANVKDIRDASIALMDKEFNQLLLEKINTVAEEYAKINNIKIFKLEGFHIVKYERGQFFKDHVDKTQEFPRKISAVFYLNDDYTGGSITFTKINKSFKPKAGTLMVFPSSEDFSHAAEAVVDGVKYVIVGFWQ